MRCSLLGTWSLPMAGIVQHYGACVLVWVFVFGPGSTCLTRISEMFIHFLGQVLFTNVCSNGHLLSLRQFGLSPSLLKSNCCIFPFKFSLAVFWWSLICIEWYQTLIRWLPAMWGAERQPSYISIVHWSSKRTKKILPLHWSHELDIVWRRQKFPTSEDIRSNMCYG